MTVRRPSGVVYVGAAWRLFLMTVPDISASLNGLLEKM